MYQWYVIIIRLSSIISANIATDTSRVLLLCTWYINFPMRDLLISTIFNISHCLNNGSECVRGRTLAIIITNFFCILYNLSKSDINVLPRHDCNCISMNKRTSSVRLSKILYQLSTYFGHDAYTFGNLSRYVIDMIFPCEITVNKDSQECCFTWLNDLMVINI